MTQDKIKNIVIIGLAVLCLILTVIALSAKSGGSVSSSAEPVSLSSISTVTSNCISENGEKLDSGAVIRKASIEGISSETTPEEVEEKAKTAGFSCTKSDSGNGDTNWNCKHDSLKETSLNIFATGGKVTKISRNGAIAAESLAPTLNQIDDYKALINTRDGVRINQSDDSYSFSIRAKTEKGDESLDYNVMNRRMRDPEDRTKITFQQIYNAALEIQ